MFDAAKAERSGKLRKWATRLPPHPSLLPLTLFFSGVFCESSGFCEETCEVRCTAAQLFRFIVFLSRCFSLMRVLSARLDLVCVVSVARTTNSGTINHVAVTLVCATTPSPIEASLVPSVNGNIVGSNLYTLHIPPDYDSSNRTSLAPCGGCGRRRDVASVFVSGCFKE